MASLASRTATSAACAAPSCKASGAAAPQGNTVSCPVRPALPSAMTASGAASSSATPFFQGARVPVARAARPAAAAQSSAVVQVRGAGEVYEVELERPYGLKFYRGADGSIYIDALFPGQSGQNCGQIQEGDKLLATSAVFGRDMWPAAEYSRVMYTVRQRIGTLQVRLEKMDGVKIGPFKKDRYLEERAAGNYGDAIREKQMENYLMTKERDQKRVELMDTALTLYRSGKYQESLMEFQTIIGMLPSYSEEAVAFYNIACCNSKLKQAQNALEALEAAMEAGFNDYKKIRSDPDLSFARDCDEFDELMDRYDEPFINENAIKALTGFFGFGKK